MKPNELNELIKYWITTARHDKITMDVLYDKARYSDCLFFGHIVLEKILKALVVRKTHQQAPYTHDLIKLAHLTGVEFHDQELKLLATTNEFNIRSRYPDYKRAFYKKCTKAYSQPYVQQIKSLYTRLCRNDARKK